jgi:predicted HTH transcriptional regulator
MEEIAMMNMNIPQETRRESHELITPIKPNLHRIILEILNDNGAMTTSEISAELYARGLSPYPDRHYASPRISELKKAGKVIPVGKKLSPVTNRNESLWQRVEWQDCRTFR